MSILTLEEFAKSDFSGKAIAGLDLGTKTIGLAVSDLSYLISNPRPVLKRTKFTIDAEKLIEFSKLENVAAFVIGLPNNMNGSEGKRVQSTRGFVHNMLQKTDIPFIFWDERLSTVAAERVLIEMDVSRKKRATRIDSAAASFILQGALDRLFVLTPDS